MDRLLDYQEKKRRLREYLACNGYDFAVIGRLDNFAWLTCGGDAKIFRNTEKGFGLIVVGMDTVHIVAQRMDIGWLMDETLKGLSDIEPISVSWREESREERAMMLCESGRVVSDVKISGADYKPEDMYAQHYPLTPREAALYERIGADLDRLLTGVAHTVKPGMTERDAEAEILYSLAKEGFSCKVLLVGSDERIVNYRHPVPSSKKVDRLLLIHPAAEKEGLNACVTRMIYFGDRLPEEIGRKYETLNHLQAMTILSCKFGARYGDLLNQRKVMLREAGCEEEFDNHYPGSITGYRFSDNLPILHDLPVRPGTYYDWFLTVQGAKVEELSVSGEECGRVLSAVGYWPRKEYTYCGKSILLPEIMMR